MQARYASCDVDPAEMVRARFTDPQATLRELFGRLVFHVLTGNTDDQAGPQPCGVWGWHLSRPLPSLRPDARNRRNGREADQATPVNGEDKRSLLEHAASRRRISC